MKKNITRRSIIKQSIVWDDVHSMINYSLPRFVLMSIIVGFLLFFLNLLIGLSGHAHSFSETLNSKLGMYFYIKDIQGEENNVSAKVIHLQQELQNKNVSTNFVSKDEAKDFLATRMPDVIGQFETYGIDNPFPATLYVKITNQEEYDTVASIMPKYGDIVLNVNDLTAGRTLQDQEKRVVRVMSFTKAMMGMTYFLIVFFIIIIGMLLFYILQTTLQRFHDKIELKKLLGATYLQIKLPFLVMLSILLLSGFVIMGVLLLISNGIIGQFDISVSYFAQLLNLDIDLSSSMFKDYVSGGIWLIIAEILIFTALTWLGASIYIQRLIKKIHMM